MPGNPGQTPSDRSCVPCFYFGLGIWTGRSVAMHVRIVFGVLPKASGRPTQALDMASHDVGLLRPRDLLST